MVLPKFVLIDAVSYFLGFEAGFGASLQSLAFPGARLATSQSEHENDSHW